MGQPRHPLDSHNAVEVDFVGGPRQQNFQSQWSHKVSDVSLISDFSDMSVFALQSFTSRTQVMVYWRF